MSTFEPFDEEAIRMKTTPNPSPGKIFTIAALEEPLEGDGNRASSRYKLSLSLNHSLK